jgi:zinc transport system ATP-binding protein
MQLSPPDAPLLTATGLRVGYNGRAILPPISLEIRPGDLWAVIGRNGGGKTTLLRTLLGLLPRVGGKLERGPGAVIGYVPQRSVLDPSVPARVVDLVQGGVEQGWSFLRPWLSSEQRRRVGLAMAAAHVVELARAQVSELSEGQKQRVLLARAMACEPRLLVLDEPTAAMDAVAEGAVFDLIDELRRERNLAVMVVAHQLQLLSGRSSHVLFVDKDEHAVMAGSFEEVAASHPFVRRYGPFLIPEPA